MLHIIDGFSQKIRMDEFSSKTVCVTPQNWNFEQKKWMSFPVKRPVWRPRIEISKNYLDEFSTYNRGI